MCPPGRNKNKKKTNFSSSFKSTIEVHNNILYNLITTKNKKEIIMNQFNYTSNKEKNKHLSLTDLRYIEREYNHFIKTKQHKQSKVKFMRTLAASVHTCLSNLYKIIKSGLIEVLNYNLTTRVEFSSDVAYSNRQTIIPNNSKLLKSSGFLNIVIKRFKRMKGLESIETIINSLKVNNKDLIKSMETISVKTFYNYVNKGLLEIKRMDLPVAVKRKKRPEKKEYIKTKGTSISERPTWINDRSEFGHWEGDSVIGIKDKKDYSLFTLVERKTRFYIAIKVRDKSATSIYRAINKLEKQYGDRFKKVFKSITFDNGTEFSRFKDIEKKRGTNQQRTTVYFAHPYSSWERGSNERHNKFLRYFIKKGTPIRDYSKDFINYACNMINNMHKKVLNYKSSLSLYNLELSKL